MQFTSGIHDADTMTDGATTPLLPLFVGGEALKASSVLNRNSKEYSPMHMIDGSEDTCWNSDTVRRVAGKGGGEHL